MTIPIITVSARIDTLTSPDLEKEIFVAIDSGNINLILDLSQATYISSVGLRVFLIAKKKVKALGGDIVLVGLRELVKHIFDISGFTSLFCFTESVDEGLAYFGSK